MVNVEEELRLLEEKATVAWGHYQEQMNTKATLQEENVAVDAPAVVGCTSFVQV